MKKRYHLHQEIQTITFIEEVKIKEENLSILDASLTSYLRPQSGNSQEGALEAK